jgi:hypothetical protein
MQTIIENEMDKHGNGGGGGAHSINTFNTNEAGK